MTRAGYDASVILGALMGAAVAHALGPDVRRAARAAKHSTRAPKRGGYKPPAGALVIDVEHRRE